MIALTPMNPQWWRSIRIRTITIESHTTPW